MNLSGRQLAEPDLVGDVVRILDRYGIEPGSFGLEVTETVLTGDPGLAREQLMALRGHGVRISLDDFGTGYSSLTYLQRFPFDEVKIDRSFVHGLCASGSEEAIVAAVIGLGHALDMRVIAEGVEHADQLGTLRELGCDLASGWHFAAAMAADDLARFSKAANRSAMQGSRRAGRTARSRLAEARSPGSPERSAIRRAASGSPERSAIRRAASARRPTQRQGNP